MFHFNNSIIICNFVSLFYSFRLHILRIHYKPPHIFRLIKPHEIPPNVIHACQNSKHPRKQCLSYISSTTTARHVKQVCNICDASISYGVVRRTQVILQYQNQPRPSHQSRKCNKAQRLVHTRKCSPSTASSIHTFTCKELKVGKMFLYIFSYFTSAPDKQEENVCIISSMRRKIYFTNKYTTFMHICSFVCRVVYVDLTFVYIH